MSYHHLASERLRQPPDWSSCSSPLFTSVRLARFWVTFSTAVFPPACSLAHKPLWLPAASDRSIIHRSLHFRPFCVCFPCPQHSCAETALVGPWTPLGFAHIVCSARQPLPHLHGQVRWHCGTLGSSPLSFRGAFSNTLPSDVIIPPVLTGMHGCTEAQRG